MKKLAIIVPAATALTLAFGGGVASLQAAPGDVTTERYYLSETWHAFSGKEGKGKPTDIYVFQDTIKTTDGRSVGVVDGYYVNLKASISLTATATLPGGTLLVGGATHSDTQVVSIAGGTGRYAGAGRDRSRCSDAGDKGSLAVVRYSRRAQARQSCAPRYASTACTRRLARVSGARDSLAKMWRICVSTVFGATNRRSPIPRSVRPSAMSASTSRSRAVRSSSGAAGRARPTRRATRSGSTTTPRRNAPHRVGELADVEPILEQVAAAPFDAVEQAERVLASDVLREHEHADGGPPAADRGRGDEPFVGVRRRHADVDDRDVGLVGAEHEQLLRRRDPDHVETPFLEQARDALPYERRVVGDHDAHGISAWIRVPRPGGLSTASSPSSASMRSARPRSPEPPASAPPTPSSSPRSRGDRCTRATVTAAGWRARTSRRSRATRRRRSTRRSRRARGDAPR